MDVHPTKNVSIGIDPYPFSKDLNNITDFTKRARNLHIGDSTMFGDQHASKLSQTSNVILDQVIRKVKGLEVSVPQDRAVCKLRSACKLPPTSSICLMLQLQRINCEGLHGRAGETLGKYDKFHPFVGVKCIRVKISRRMPENIV